MIAKVRRERIPDEQALLRDVQRNLADLLDLITKRCPLIDGVLLEDVALSGTAVDVAHLLGRVPIGWIVAGQNASASIFEVAARTDRFLNLQASAAVTADVWVF